MSLLQITRDPSPRQLRQFGLIAAVALPLLGWWLSWPDGWLSAVASSGLPMSRFPWIAGFTVAGVLLATVGFINPRVLKPLFVGLSWITLPIGLVVSELMLGFLYFAVLTPVGLVMRLAGRDALGRRLDRKEKSYWQPSAGESDPESYYRQS